MIPLVKTMQSGNYGFSISRQRLAIESHHKTTISIGFNFISTHVKLRASFFLTFIFSSVKGLKMSSISTQGKFSTNGNFQMIIMMVKM